MGLFSSSYKSSVVTSSNPLIEPDKFVDTRVKLILDAIRNSGSIPGAIFASNYLGFNGNVRQYISYGRKKYIHGLPENTFIGARVDWLAVEDYIVQHIDPSAIVTSVYLGPPRQSFVNKLAAIETWAKTRQFVIDELAAGRTLQRKDLQWKCHYVDQGDNPGYEECSYVEVVKDITDIDQLPVRWNALDRFVYTPDFVSSTSVSKKKYLVQMVNPVWTGRTFGKKWTAPTASNYLQGNHLQVIFIGTDANGNDYESAWHYKVGSGGIPEFDLPIDTSTSEFLPVGLMRHDQRNYNDKNNSEDYITTTERLLKKIEINAEEILDEGMEAANEALKKASNTTVWDYFIYFGVPVNGITQGSKEYMYEFLSFLRGFTTSSPLALSLASDAAWQAHNKAEAECHTGSSDDICLTPSPATYGEYSEIVVKEGGNTGYHCRFRWSFIIEKKFTGTLPERFVTEVVKNSSSKGKALLRKFVPGYADSLAQVQFPKEGAGYWGGGEAAPVVAVYKRNSDLKGYTGMLCFGLEQAYLVNTKDGTKVSVNNLLDEENRGEFYLPISIGILKGLNGRREEQMLQESIRGTFFIVTRVKIKWYQKGIFKFIFVVLTVALIIWTGQFQFMKFAVAMASATAFVKFVVVNILLSMWVQFVAMEVLGGKMGMFFMLMLAVFMPGNMEALAKNLSSAFKNFSFASAMKFVNAVTELAQTGMQFYQQGVLGDINREMEELQKTYKEKQQELEEQYYNIVGQNLADPNSIMKTPQPLYLEGPAEFYSRTLNSNAGLLSLEAIESFVGLCLMLPEKPDQPNYLDVVFEQNQGGQDGRQYL